MQWMQELLVLIFRLTGKPRICQFSSLHREIYDLKGKGHEPSRAENSSARATARVSSVRAHHYLPPAPLTHAPCTHTFQTKIFGFSSLWGGGGGMWNVCVRGARVSGVGRRECLSKYALTTGGQNKDGVATCQSTKKQLCKIRRPCRAVEKTGPSTLTKECQICHQRTWCGVRRARYGVRWALAS